VAVIVAAGNDDVNACRISPASSFGTIVVGAEHLIEVRSLLFWRSKPSYADLRSAGTAWGPCIDLYAPDSYANWWGTSFSAAYVSGAAALYLETKPNASPNDILSYLKGSATMNVVADAK